MQVPIQTPQAIRTALILLFVCGSLSFGVFPSPGFAADSQSPSALTIYVIPAITDDRILPDTILSPSLISDEIVITAAPGEYEPASFVLRPEQAISNLRVEPTDLVSSAGSLPADVIDIRVVKCWYQAGDSKYKEGAWVLLPELLLKDDSLVRVEDGENYLKVNGEYLWISSPDGTIPGIRWMPTPEQLPIHDAVTLQPVDIPAGINKQFWITAHVPADAVPGTYTGRIRLTAGQIPVGEITLYLRILPFDLVPPLLTYSMYYDGQLQSSGEGSISSRWKTEAQLRAEFRNLLEHGVTHPVVTQSLDDLDLLRKYLRIMRESGLSTASLFLRSGGKMEDANLGFGTPSDPDELAAVENKAREVIGLAQAEGFSDVYFYGICEPLGQYNSVELLTSQRPVWEAIHRVGGKVFDSGVRVGAYSDERQPGNFGFMGDIQDLLNCNGVPSAEEANRWHSMGHRIFCYSNPQAGVEKPETYRRNYGLLLWQADYDGAMPYAYQVGRAGNIWNDWRSPDSDHRNRAMAYPTADGVIDTLQWEGWREGVDDVRYLTTLLKTIETAKAQGKDTARAEAFISGLEQSDLARQDPGEIRSEIIGHILGLLGAGNAVDTRAPQVLNMGCSLQIGTSVKAVVRWVTDEPARGAVEYGEDLTLASAVPPGNSFRTQHEIEIEGLRPGMVYYYRLVAIDSSGNRAISNVFTFTTPASGTVSAGQLVPAMMSHADLGNDPKGLAEAGGAFAPDRSLVGWWGFDGESDLKDRSAYANDISVNRGTAYTPEGEVGGARVFRDGSGILKCQTSGSLGVRDGLTIAMWVRGEGGGTDFPRLIEKASSYYLGWRLVGGGFRCPFLAIYSGGTTYYRYFGTALSADSFTHLVAVYDASTGRIDCYTNGVLDNDATDGLPPPGSKIDASESDLRMGASFIGALDDVRIWNRPLSAAEVRALYEIKTVVNSPLEIVAPKGNEEMYTASIEGGSSRGGAMPSGTESAPAEYMASASVPPAPAGISASSVGPGAPLAPVPSSSATSSPEKQGTISSSESYIASTSGVPTPPGTPYSMANTPGSSEAIAWSPYESPQNPGDLGIYLMGKGEASTGAEALVHPEGLASSESSDDQAGPVFVPTDEEPFSRTFVRYMGYLVVSLAAVGALILWAFRRAG